MVDCYSTTCRRLVARRRSSFAERMRWVVLGRLDRSSVLNAIPTTTGFADLQLKEDAPLQMVELYPSFADSTDMDEAMTYAIVDNSNPVLLTTLYIGSTGRLLLQSAANATVSPWSRYKLPIRSGSRCKRLSRRGRKR